MNKAGYTKLTLGGASCSATGWQISTDLLVFSSAFGRSVVLGGAMEDCCG